MFEGTTNVMIYMTFEVFIFTLMMEAVQTSEILVPYHNTTWHHNPEDLNLNHNTYFAFFMHINMKCGFSYQGKATVYKI